MEAPDPLGTFNKDSRQATILSKAPATERVEINSEERVQVYLSGVEGFAWRYRNWSNRNKIETLRSCSKEDRAGGYLCQMLTTLALHIESQKAAGTA